MLLAGSWKHWGGLGCHFFAVFFLIKLAVKVKAIVDWRCYSLNCSLALLLWDFHRNLFRGNHKHILTDSLKYRGLDKSRCRLLIVQMMRVMWGCKWLEVEESQILITSLSYSFWELAWCLRFAHKQACFDIGFLRWILGTLCAQSEDVFAMRSGRVVWLLYKGLQKHRAFDLHSCYYVIFRVELYIED